MKAFLIFLIFLCNYQSSFAQKVKEPVYVIDSLNIQKLLYKDSLRSIQTESLKAEILKANLSIQELKQPKSDPLKWTLPLLSLLLGSLFTVLWNVKRDAYKERQSEKKAISRWKAEISNLAPALVNQVRYNSEILAQLEVAAVIPITPTYDFTLTGHAFSGLDNGQLFHFLEKKDKVGASEKSAAIQSMVGAFTDLSKKNMLIVEKYQDKIGQHYDKLNLIVQQLQREVGKIHTAYSDNPDRTDEEADLIRELIDSFTENLLNQNGNYEALTLADTTFRPIHLIANALRGAYQVAGLLEVTMDGIYVVAAIHAERTYLTRNLQLVNENLNGRSSEIPAALEFFKVV